MRSNNKSPQIQLIKIEGAILSAHVNLTPSDKCFHWRSYTTRKDWNFSETDQLIKNFQIKSTEKDRRKYKKEIPICGLFVSRSESTKSNY